VSGTGEPDPLLPGPELVAARSCVALWRWWQVAWKQLCWGYL
jgi:hypothetical protein